VKKVELSLCLIKHHAMKMYGEVKVKLHGTRWRQIVSLMPQLLYPRGKSPQCPLGRRQGGPWSWSSCCEENLLDLLGIESQFLRHAACSLVAILTGL
jgi:hypothetical protein